MLARRNPMTAATAKNTAVQEPWFERAFREIEILSMPDPAAKE